MAGKPGRPKSKNPRPSTTFVRVPPDLAAMMAEVCRLHGVTSAQFLDALIRKQIEAKYEAIRPQLVELAKLSKEAKRRLESVDAALMAARLHREGD